MLDFCLLSSGSKANCLYVRSEHTQVLVDCGLSAREASRRLRSIDVDPQSIQAIIVSHEHSDHISGIPVFVRQNRCHVMANPATFSASRLTEVVEAEYLREFETGAAFEIGDILIEPFCISHDAADPVAFRIQSGDLALGVVTDLGQVTTLVKERTRNLDALILESNHDPLLLRESSYPWELKQRISGRNGHLSNEDAASLLQHIQVESSRHPKVVVAAHISENSNEPMLALDTLKTAWRAEISSGVPEFIAANAYKPTPLYRL